ncbi:hypothetical protein AJ80_00638 [Polytolypa hystricis UAMH7299]|uniref:Ecp2 effector protein domain-containing protein n=1 Tax=Polytolypa hystricis (strain UAMH7299) TaxID=1447883 RepID=A0A2B7Z1Z0_POLH7|nr:hypothetical protein AJ80_00638 [Polytolypa hystricis UAMH7299]
MSPFSKLTLLLPFLAVGIRGLEAPIPGYRVEDITWAVEYAPGKNTTLTGTVQQVYAQLLDMNPQYEAQFGTIEHNATAVEDEDEDVTTRSKREHTICNPFPRAPCNRINEGISYLTRVNGRPTNGPGPGNCGRVSCSWSSAIWWCNDNRRTHTLSSFRDIANAAKVAVKDCRNLDKGCQVSGQRFLDDNWNVIVRGQKC